MGISRQLDVEFLNDNGLDASGLSKEYLNLVMDSTAFCLKVDSASIHR